MENFLFFSAAHLLVVRQLYICKLMTQTQPCVQTIPRDNAARTHETQSPVEEHIT